MITSISVSKLFFAFIILIGSTAGGLWPFLNKKFKSDLNTQNSPISSKIFTAESFASGVFLGAGLLHMLPEATEDFFHAGYHYPAPFLIAGSVFLFLLLLEHISVSVDSTLKPPFKFPSRLALLTTLILSIHSFLEGSALGISPDLATTLIIFMAIIAHKSAASFALATQLNQSDLKLKAQLLAFALFALMTPLGIFMGTGISAHSLSHPHHSGCLLLTPIFSSMAAGTFLYIGTLHGLERANLIRNCSQIREFFYMLLGFCLMAVIAIWA